MQILIDKFTAQGYTKRRSTATQAEEVVYQKEFSDGCGTLFCANFYLFPLSTKESYAELHCNFVSAAPFGSIQINSRYLSLKLDVPQLERTLLGMWYSGQFEYLRFNATL